jgi:hypothetical protein
MQADEMASGLQTSPMPEHMLAASPARLQGKICAVEWAPACPITVPIYTEEEIWAQSLSVDISIRLLE